MFEVKNRTQGCVVEIFLFVVLAGMEIMEVLGRGHGKG